MGHHLLLITCLMPVAIIISCIMCFDFDFGLRFYVQLHIK